MEALQKLIASGGDTSVLSADEKALLQNELAKYAKTDDKYDTNELQNLHETMQKVKEYKDSTDEETLGKYYQDRG
jgi:predicted secreted Zn-dependent protease